MQQFEVLITEFLTKTVSVTAKNKNEALLKVSNQWKDEEIILYADNFSDVEFEVLS